MIKQNSGASGEISVFLVHANIDMENRVTIGPLPKIDGLTPQHTVQNVKNALVHSVPYIAGLRRAVQADPSYLNDVQFWTVNGVLLDGRSVVAEDVPEPRVIIVVKWLDEKIARGRLRLDQARDIATSIMNFVAADDPKYATFCARNGG